MAEIGDKHPEFTRRIDEWLKVRNCVEGASVVKDLGVEYLPRPEGMKHVHYQAYKKRAVFYAVLERTLRGLVGLVFRIEPTVEVPEVLEGLKTSATPEGFSLETVMRNTVREVLSLGRYGLLLDMPSSLTTDPASFYLAEYSAENIWRWEERTVDGKRLLHRIILRDDTELFGEEEVTQLRELYLDPETGNYTVQPWREVAAESNTRSRYKTNSPASFGDSGGSSYDRFGDPTVPVVRGQPLRQIPFVFVNAYDLAAKPSKSPMIDLAEMNLAHYRNSADYEHALYLTAQPTPWIAAAIDDTKKPKSIGSGTIWLLPKESSVGMLEFSGASISALDGAMTKKEGRMAALGARLIQDQDRSNVTAETTRLQSREETSVLLSTVGNVQLAFERVLGLAADWAGAPRDEIDLGLNRDIIETRLDPGEVDALVRGWQARAYSHRTLYANLQRGEIADPKRAFEEELELLEEEGPADAPTGAPPIEETSSEEPAEE